MNGLFCFIKGVVVKTLRLVRFPLPFDLPFIIKIYLYKINFS